MSDHVLATAGESAHDAARRGGRRAVRVGTLGGSSVLLACVAHTAGGGSLPPWWALLVLSAFVGTIAVALTARRLRFRGLALVLLAEQTGLHLAFGLGGAGGCSAPADSHTGLMPGMSMAACTVTPTTAAHGIPESPVLPMLPMLLAHLAATLLTAALLARGESLLWRIADRVIAGASARPTRRRPRSPRPVVPVRFDPWARVGSAPADPRGPPRRLLAAG